MSVTFFHQRNYDFAPLFSQNVNKDDFRTRRPDVYIVICISENYSVARKMLLLLLFGWLFIMFSNFFSFFLAFIVLVSYLCVPFINANEGRSLVKESREGVSRVLNLT